MILSILYLHWVPIEDIKSRKGEAIVDLNLQSYFDLSLDDTQLAEADIKNTIKTVQDWIFIFQGNSRDILEKYS